MTMKNETFILTFLLLFFYGLAIGQGSWVQKANFPGSAKDYSTGFSIGTKGYWGTGMDTSGNFTNDFWEYDPSTNLWTQMANVPGSNRWLACGFSIGNKGYIGLGVDSSDTCLKDFWEYDPSTNLWTQKADFGGGPRASVAAFSINNKGYVGTGFSIFSGGTVVNDFWEYNPSTNIWTQKAAFPGMARSESIGFSIGNEGYIGTGITISPVTYFDDFWEWNQTTNVWTQKANFGGGPICDAAGFSICSDGYICIGEKTGGIYTNELWEYNQAANSWIQKLSFGGTARDETIGITINNKGYVGMGEDTIENLNDLWEYTPDTLCNEGINETNIKNFISIHPNPFSLETTISSDKYLENITLTFYNLFGQQVKQIKNICGHSIKIYKDDLQSGLYIIQLTQNNKIIATNKLIITE